MGIFDIFKRNKIVDPDYENTLYKEVNANKINKNIKLLVISDTHGDLALNKDLQKKLISIKDFDLCCILGDIHDKDYEFILDNISDERIVALLGNHDRFGLVNEKGLTDLNGRVVEVNGLKIGGIQGSYKYKHENFPSFTHDESISFMESMPYVDILLSHDKPFAYDYHDPAHDGLKGITKYLYDNKVPINIHGHIHKSYCSKLKNGTLVKGVYRIELITIKNGIIED